MYYRRPVRKTIFSYIMPLMMIIAIFLVMILGWKLLSSLLGGKAPDPQNERVFMSIEKGNVRAMTTELGQWQNAPDKIYLYRGESVKTGVDSQATLTYFDQSVMRMNSSGEAQFSVLAKKKDVSTIATHLKTGEVWVKVEKKTNPDSSFDIDTDLLSVGTKEGTMAIVAPGTVRMIKGQAQISLKQDDAIVKAMSLGVGQEIKVDAESIRKLREGETVDLLSALDDEFKKTDWYLWNRSKDGTISAFEETEMPSNDEQKTANKETSGSTGIAKQSVSISETTPSSTVVAYVTSPSKKSVVQKSPITVKGYYDVKTVSAVFFSNQAAKLSPEENVWTVENVVLNQEGQNTFKMNARDLAGTTIDLSDVIINYDKTPPSAPVLQEPGLNGSSVTIEVPEQVIRGSVSADTDTIFVNDYQLGLYIPGSKTFQYYAKAAYGNLVAGKNEYSIVAEDKAGNRSDPAVITLVIAPEKITSIKTVEPAAKEPAAGEASASSAPPPPAKEPAATPAPEITPLGGLTITSPNGGKDLTSSETFFELSGTVAPHTAKIVVNDYTLNSYKPEDQTWTYRASTSLGNLKANQANLFTATAFDSGGNKIGEDSITITVTTEKLSTPVINMPVSNSSYSTNLNVIPLGGTVNTITEKVYLNDEPIPYEQGTGKWRKSVTLTKGSNRFRVYAAKGDQKSAEATITIHYMP